MDLFVLTASPPEISVPEFHVTSYVSLPINDKVGRSLSYEIWFLSTQPNGAILYSTQEDKENGDFISLAMVNGHLQFRFDLGGGIANITLVFLLCDVYLIKSPSL